MNNSLIQKLVVSAMDLSELRGFFARASLDNGLSKEQEERVKRLASFYLNKSIEVRNLINELLGIS